ncbi:pentapeptide repeat-containing protein [Legionella waltersii]|uniref:Uncharacterized protein n=1 Tax=Legionella waltersii TaxID=66969 RepID=A0A0W1A1Q6_9GAMM|nr:pentapeptide repeat-containing protein [Legionella waltersii]KTD75240.1 hypothetical protein Lwal_3281 [Legionella waltersii]SNV06659.1 Uncharacterised protein [Legionella waltersii]
MTFIEIITQQKPIGSQQQMRQKMAHSNFSKALNQVDFEESNLYESEFNEDVNDCNFMNAKLAGSTFRKNIKGFSCFSGADLNGVHFYGECDHTVLFIGSNISPDDTKSLGGIQTVSQLEKGLREGQYTQDQIDTLYKLLSLAYQQVGEALETFAKTQYHINDNHLDHIHLAMEIVKKHMSSNPQDLYSIKI